MAKKVKQIITVQAPAGKANPAPPIGPALGQHGVNIMEFVTKFNDQTKEMGDVVIPAEITIYEDRTFTFRLKTPPASILLKKAAGLETAAKTPGKEKVGKVTMAQVREIAEKKMSDLNAGSLESAQKMIIGTANSMGIEVEGK